MKAEAFILLCMEISASLGERKEVFTLRDILCDYEEIQRSLSLTDNEIRTSRNDTVALAALRRQLEHHFGPKIGFQSRFRRNQSQIVFFPEHGGSYVESVVNCWGVDMTESIRNVAKLLHANHKNDPSVKWPCSVYDLLPNRTCDDMHNLVALLADPTAAIVEGRAVITEQLQPAIRFLSESRRTFFNCGTLHVHCI